MLALLFTLPLDAQTTRLASEYLNHNGSTFAVTDRATGTIRVGTTDSAGQTSFSRPVFTGIPNVTDTATLGSGTPYTLLLTSPEANRVASVRIDGSAPFSQDFAGAVGIGPRALGQSQESGTVLLSIGSIANGHPVAGAQIHDGLIESYLQDATQSPSLAREELPLRIEPYLPGANTPALVTSADGENTVLRLLLHTKSGTNYAPAVGTKRVTLTGLVHPLTGITNLKQQPLALLYRTPDTATFSPTVAHLVTPQAPYTSSSSLTTHSVNLPYAVAAIVPVTAPVGNLSDGILLLAADGSQAEWFRINATSSDLVATGETFLPPAGETLTGILPTPNGLVTLSAAGAGAPSAHFQTQQYKNGHWTQTSSGSLPELPTEALANSATLFFYSTDPTQTEASHILGIQYLPHWTRRSNSDPVPTSILRETFSATTGLSTPVSAAITPPAGTGYVLTNQVDPALSLATTASSLADLYSPALEINPASGSYQNPFQITAQFDARKYQLLYRHSTGAWETWTGPVGVSYTASYQFRLEDLKTGESGGLLSRSYTFTDSDHLYTDSNGDGVPDYVKMALGLNPFGSADSDGDGVSDLAEILAGTDPNDANDRPNSNDIPDVATNSTGLDTYATARSVGSGSAVIIKKGEQLTVRTLDGSILSQAQVKTHFTPSPLDVAHLRADQYLPSTALVTFSSPLYFDLTSGERNGREIVLTTTIPRPKAFSVNFVPTGTDLAADAQGWINAARSAWNNYKRTTAVTSLSPFDTAVSVLLEHIVHSALAQSRPAGDPAPSLSNFTLFPARGADQLRTPITAVDLDLLAHDGFSLRRARSAAKSVQNSLTPLANAVYSRHIAKSETTPGMMLPLDALRVILRTGTAPEHYQTSGITNQIGTARTAYHDALNGANAFRPTATWTIAIPTPAGSLGTALYTRTAPGAPTTVQLLDANLSPFPLTRGLGLKPGSQFSVLGYTDTHPDIDGHPTMEVIAVTPSFLPTASDNDQDGNLLDDEWERFFYGETGQAPLEEVRDGYTKLDYFLQGLDPRGDDLPTGDPFTPEAQTISFTRNPDGTQDLDFTFPDAHYDRFDITVETSTDLTATSWTPIANPNFTREGPNHYRLHLAATHSIGPRRFFRLRISLKP